MHKIKALCKAQVGKYTGLKLWLKPIDGENERGDLPRMELSKLPKEVVKFYNGRDSMKVQIENSQADNTKDLFLPMAVGEEGGY